MHLISQIRDDTTVTTNVVSCIRPDHVLFFNKHKQHVLGAIRGRIYIMQKYTGKKHKHMHTNTQDTYLCVKGRIMGKIIQLTSP